MKDNARRQEKLLEEVLEGMRFKPGPLRRRLKEELEEFSDATSADIEEILARTLTTQSGDGCQALLQDAILKWDARTAPNWSDGAAGTVERRNDIYRRLKLKKDLTERLDDSIPPVGSLEQAVCVSGPHEWWYRGKRAAGGFYWNQYQEFLEKSGWPPESVGSLERSTRTIVARLRDPDDIADKGLTAGDDTLKGRGLVVGYVQSGKTANFTGVIARAIDAGYRIIVVLAGTIEILRQQTLRRLDKELLGIEVLKDYEEDRARYEEQGDLNEFVSYGYEPAAHGAPFLNRMSEYSRDLRGSGATRAARIMTLRHRYARAYTASAMRGREVTVFVVKKHATVLQKLNKTLEGVRDEIRSVPALVIDDESDQAGLNTSRPLTTDADQTKRTTTNAEIVKLLKDNLPHGQYLGYTATPFANALVNKDDPADLYPRDFILSLGRPTGYMGVRDFYDVDDDAHFVPDEARPSGMASNKRAFYRPIRDPEIEVAGNAKDQVLEAEIEDLDEMGLSEEMRERAAEFPKLLTALDSYVLAGVLKCFREQKSGKLRYAHHTMLVHVSVGKIKHREIAELLNSFWWASNYRTGRARKRLERLWAEDFASVSQQRWDAEMLASDPKMSADLIPGAFSDLRPYIGACLDRIEATITRTGSSTKGIDGQKSPVTIVNSDREFRDTRAKFDDGDVWCIFSGGNALSRGYTVAGLTTTYYRRKAGQADSLMQMGRWFGFRSGYRDLIRLYLGIERHRRNDVMDLYEEFGALCQDEEAFREQLAQYVLNEGVSEEELEPDDPRWKERITPLQIPPLIESHSRFLRPTGRNKMWNAILTSENFGGRWHEKTTLPDPNVKKEKGLAKQNLALLDDLVQSAGGWTPTRTQLTFRQRIAGGGHKDELRRWEGGLSVATFSLTQFKTFLEGFRFRLGATGGSSAEHRRLLEFVRTNKSPGNNIERCVVLGLHPQREDRKRPSVSIAGRSFQAFVRKRSTAGSKDSLSPPIRSISEMNHRRIAEFISQADLPGDEIEVGGPLEPLRDGKTAVILLYPSYDDSRDILAEGRSTGKKAVRPLANISLAHAILCPPNRIPSRTTFRQRDTLQPDAAVIEEP